MNGARTSSSARPPCDFGMLRRASLACTASPAIHAAIRLANAVTHPGLDGIETEPTRTAHRAKSQSAARGRPASYGGASSRNPGNPRNRIRGKSTPLGEEYTVSADSGLNVFRRVTASDQIPSQWRSGTSPRSSRPFHLLRQWGKSELQRRDSAIQRRTPNQDPLR
jgi:hypothetical protein